MKIARTLGLVAIAALALTATVGASSASASGFMAERYPAFFQGTQESSATLTTSLGSQKCSGLTMSGTLSGANQTLTMPTTDGSCSLGKMKMNGCKFILHPGAEGTGAGTFDIGPMGCGPITTGTGCELAIPVQTGLAAEYTNQLEGSKARVVFSVNTNALKYTELNCYKKPTQTAAFWVNGW